MRLATSAHRRGTFAGSDLLRRIPGVQPSPVMECSGHDGTYAMNNEGSEPSQRLASRAIAAMRATGTEVLARAYREPSEGGFAAGPHEGVS